MEEHFPISVQFLQRPFNRVIKEEDLFEERDAFPVPVKPYFKGSNDIPDDVPTREIRKQVAAILGFKQGSEETYLGNTHKSDLHYHEELFEQLKQYISMHSVENIDSSTFSSIPTFLPKTQFISTPSFKYILPQGSGFWNGNVFDFLKHPVREKFDIVHVVQLLYCRWRSILHGQTKVFVVQKSTAQKKVLWTHTSDWRGIYLKLSLSMHFVMKTVFFLYGSPTTRVALPP